MQRDDALLLDILQFGRDVASFTAGIGEESFRRDAKTQAAVRYCLLVIGEAVRRLSHGFKLAHPDVPWTRISDFRNVLVHEYDRVSIGKLWQVTRQDLPALLDRIAPLLPEEPRGGDSAN